MIHHIWQANLVSNTQWTSTLVYTGLDQLRAFTVTYTQTCTHTLSHTSQNLISLPSSLHNCLTFFYLQQQRQGDEFVPLFQLDKSQSDEFFCPVAWPQRRPGMKFLCAILVPNGMWTSWNLSIYHTRYFCHWWSSGQHFCIHASIYQVFTVFNALWQSVIRLSVRSGIQCLDWNKCTSFLATNLHEWARQFTINVFLSGMEEPHLWVYADAVKQQSEATERRAVWWSTIKPIGLPSASCAQKAPLTWKKVSRYMRLGQQWPSVLIRTCFPDVSYLFPYHVDSCFVCNFSNVLSCLKPSSAHYGFDCCWRIARARE